MNTNPGFTLPLLLNRDSLTAYQLSAITESSSLCLIVNSKRSKTVEQKLYYIYYFRPGMDAVEKRAAGETLSVRDEQRLRNHQLRMMRRQWLNDLVSTRVYTKIYRIL